MLASWSSPDGATLISCCEKKGLCSNWAITAPSEECWIAVDLTVEKLHGGQERLRLQLPVPKSKKHPVTAPDPVHAQKITDEIGLLKVAMFPGVIGIDVAKDIDRGIAFLNGCTHLIVDLRGNTGGGIGGLRLMSYLTPGKLEVGYSLTRKRRERG